MKFDVFSIRDARTGFMTPTCDVNSEAATRNFFHAVNNSNDTLRSFAQDYSLYKIAAFDTDSGLMEPVVPPLFVASGSDAIAAFLKGAEGNAF